MKKTPENIQTIPLESIRIDGGTQSRVEISDDNIADLSAVPFTDLPPMLVMFDGAAHWLVDGFHRYHVARKAGIVSVPCEVRTGTLREAILLSLEQNAKHGLRRTNEDKRKAVETLLRDKEWGKWSDRAVAEKTGTTHPLVARIRSSLVTVTSAGPRIGLDGRTCKVKPVETIADDELPPPVTVSKSTPAAAPEEDEVEEALDELGRVIADPRVASVFASERAGDLLNAITFVIRDIKMLCGSPEGSRLNRAAAESHAKNLKAAIKDSQPHAVCPYPHVKGQTCQMCKGTGWVSKFEYTAIPEEIRKAAEA